MNTKLRAVNFHLLATENHKRLLTRRAKWSKMPFNNEMCSATSGMNQSGSERWVVGRGLCTQLWSWTQDQLGSSYNTNTTKGNDHFGSHGKTKNSIWESEILRAQNVSGYWMPIFITNSDFPVVTWTVPFSAAGILPWSFRIFWVTSYIAYGKCDHHWSNPK